MSSAFAATGKMDPGTFRITYGMIEPDPRTHGHRYREYWTWREGGKKFGSWVWKRGEPPPVHPDRRNVC